MTWEVRQGDCREAMATLHVSSVDAIVTDPPYGLAFMGKAWDHGVPGLPFWTEAMRVAKPGAHLVAFGGTRTYHRLTCAIEDAGWEIRDCLMWLYGSGFPKSLDASKAIDKAAGAEREDLGPNPNQAGRTSDMRGGRYGRAALIEDAGEISRITEPATDAARQWAGWGTALKPAWEPIILARKPLVGTVAANVLEHGTGALNVDGCRIEHDEECREMAPQKNGLHNEKLRQGGRHHAVLELKPAGRWPANLVLDEEAAAMLDEQSGKSKSPPVGSMGGGSNSHSIYGDYAGQRHGNGFGDSGGASRFFYTAKASSGERHYAGKNAHPTVKPVDLMRWLVRLVTLPGGLVLDPFTGSGSTGVAALAEGARFLGIELDPEHVATARRRIAGPLFAEASA